MYSDEIDWRPNSSGKTELFLASTAEVNIDYLKSGLRNDHTPVITRVISEFALDKINCRLLINGASPRELDATKIREASPFLPCILSYCPVSEDENGHIVWDVDLVDGHHRIAAVLEAGRTTMPFVYPSPIVSLMATRPKPEYQGVISLKSNFPRIHSAIDHQHLVRDLTKIIGRKFKFIWVD